MHVYEALDRVEPGFLKRLQAALDQQQLQSRTEQQHKHWIARFMLFNGMQPPATLTRDDMTHFLAFVEGEGALSRAKLNSVRQALELLFDQVLAVSDETPTRAGKITAAG